MRNFITYLFSLIIIYFVHFNLKAQQFDSVRTITGDTLAEPTIKIYYGDKVLSKELLLKKDIRDESLIPLAYLIINQNPGKYNIKADSLYIYVVKHETIPRQWIRIRSDDAVFILRWPPNTPLEKGTKIIFEFYYSYYDKNTKLRIGKRFTHRTIDF